MHLYTIRAGIQCTCHTGVDRGILETMDWSAADIGGGGYFNEADATPSGKSGTKSAARQQFLCPVTIRQVIEAPEDGLKIGNFTAAMVSLAGIVLDVDVSSTKVKFTLSDDTGVIDCIEWLESDEGETPKNSSPISLKTYYQVFGCIKSLQGQRRIMVFKVTPIQNFNEYTAFMTEVLSVNQYAEKINQMPVEAITHENSYSSFKNTNYDDNRAAFNPVQTAILQEIRAVEDQAGWSRKDSNLNSKFSKKQIDDALDFLISEGHIYSTIDDDHYSST